MDTITDFSQFGLSEFSLEAIRKKGFTAPSPIQIKIIPELLSGTGDLIGQAQTGTGKTAAFSIPILELCKEGLRHPQALILAPTRELSMQIAEEVNSLKGDRDLNAAAFYGGENIELQLRKMRKGMDIVIGTPGRILDLIRRKELDLSELAFAVLDEADEMLDMGFIDDIHSILGSTNPEKRTLLFSATVPDEVLDIAAEFMKDFQIIRTETPELGDGLTDQICFIVRREDKLEALARIIELEESFYGLIFCRTKFDVDDLSANLKQRGFNVEALHGDIAQPQRTRVIARFKAKKFKILVATDVAARGIDVADLTHVVNFSLPEDPESYVHRIGRTGRAGKSGTAITFVAPNETRRLAFIERKANTEIRRGVLPCGADLVEAKKQRFRDSIVKLMENGIKDEYQILADELSAQYQDPAKVLAAVMQLKFRKELLESAYNDLTVQDRPSRDRHSFGRRDSGRFERRDRFEDGDREFRGRRSSRFDDRGDFDRPRRRRDRFDDREVYDRPRRRGGFDEERRERFDRHGSFARHGHDEFSDKGSRSGFRKQNNFPNRRPKPGRKPKD